MVSSFEVVLELESANASPIVAGLNATARPTIELALRKQRRDLSSGCFILCSFRAVPGCGIAWSSCRDSLLRFQYQGAYRVKTKSGEAFAWQGEQVLSNASSPGLPSLLK